jgi:GTP-binding protein Era
VTSKPQTTRHRILAVHSGADTQIVFVDTPGIHRKAERAMNRLMNRIAGSALADADLVLFVCDATRWTDEDDDVLRRLKSVKAPIIALLNKVDRVHPKERLFAKLAELSARLEFTEIFPLSALKKNNLNELMAAIPAFLPESPFLFPKEMHTDRGVEFQAAEVIREKLTLMLHQEVPYGLTVQIERYATADEQVTIDAVVWVDRESQKGIVVGKGGQVLKTVGQAARLDLCEQLRRRVHLELWVKVKDNWSDSEQDLLRLGYE